MEEVTVHTQLGMQVIVLPERYRFDVETVYLMRAGIALLVIPANDEGDEFVQARREALLTDPERMARWHELVEPYLTPEERDGAPGEPDAGDGGAGSPGLRLVRGPLKTKD